MRLSIRLFGFPMSEYAALARCGDEFGFEAVWVPDHLIPPSEFAPNYPYSETGRPTFTAETQFADPWVMLGHLAASTRKIKLGVGVFILPLRDPFVVAKAVATVQELSGGRVLFGVGIGWMREEFGIVGQRFARRAERTAEMMEVMRKLWSGRPVVHDGFWYKFPEVQMSPGVVPPPIFLGGSSDAAIGRAAALGDGWYGPPCALEEAKSYRRKLNEALEKQGRDVGEFHIWVRAPEPATRDVLNAYEAAGFDHLVVNVPRNLPDAAQRLAWLSEIASTITLK